MLGRRIDALEFREERERIGSAIRRIRDGLPNMELHTPAAAFQAGLTRFPRQNSWNGPWNGFGGRGMVAKLLY